MRQIVTALLATFVLTDCSDYKHFESKSPDGLARIVISEPGMIRSDLKVVLRQDTKESVLFERKGDLTFWVAHVYWSPDDREVAVFYLRRAASSSCGEPAEFEAD
jgi:hypothetical protein